MAAFSAFDPAKTFLHLGGDGAAALLEGGERFWKNLRSGRLRLADGYLAMASDMNSDTGHWEMHPRGEEALLRLSGAFTLVMEREDGTQDMLRLDGDAPAAVVPRGVWHRIEVAEPGRLIFVTWGAGTRHRPR